MSGQAVPRPLAKSTLKLEPCCSVSDSRARVVPLWAAAAVVIGIVLHPVAFGLGYRPLDILAYALVTAGCVAAARTVLMTSNDAWDLPPRSVRGLHARRCRLVRAVSR